MDEKLEYQKYQKLKRFYQEKVSRIASVRLVAFIVMIVSFILKYYYYPLFFLILFVSFLILFVILVFIHDKYYKKYDYYASYVEILNTYLDRENGKWKDFLDKGEDFLDDKSLIFSDLDVLGNGSLFQFLSICKTLGGRERLFYKLSNIELDSKTLKLEQDAILELTNKIQFDVEFQIAIRYYDQKKIHLSHDFSYLDRGVGSRKRDFFIGIVASCCCWLFFLLGCFGFLSFSYFYGMFFFNYMLSFMYSYIFKDDFSCLEKTVYNYGKLSGVMDCILKEKFSSLKLKNIWNRIEKGKIDIIRLSKIDSMNSLRNNLLANFFFNGFFCFNLILLYRFSLFLDSSLGDLKDSICDIEQLEAMVSLASLGIVKNHKCMPSYSEEVILNFLDLKHPLLDEDVCVGNDFEGNDGVYIITGSNMGGKSTLLRTIGINLILMNAGCYVCAKKFQSSYFKLFTSISVRDDIKKGISTFYGELLRIQEMVQYVDKGNMLVLIDEIFKGTNYQDRIYGAREVIKKFHTKRTIAFITTHDFELCEEKRIHNYHVKEDYQGDKIIFDYKLRKGKCTSTNAKYLMRKLHIIK
ncbi:MAG: hypothetical protein ACI4U0_04060 [Candidatus Aphodocola sp.]